MSHHINTLEEAGQIGQPASHKKSSLNRLPESAVRNLAAMLPKPRQELPAFAAVPSLARSRRTRGVLSPTDSTKRTQKPARRRIPIASYINNLTANTPAPSSPSPSSPAPSKLEPPNLGLLPAPSAGRRCHPNSTPKGAVQHQKRKIRNEPKLNLKVLESMRCTIYCGPDREPAASPARTVALPITPPRSDPGNRPNQKCETNPRTA